MVQGEFGVGEIIDADIERRIFADFVLNACVYDEEPIEGSEYVWCIIGVIQC